MKKLISVLIAAALTIISVFTAFAAETPDSTGAEKLPSKYKIVSTVNIKQGTMLFYPYNLSPTTTAQYRLKDVTTGTSTTVSMKDSHSYPKTINISSTDTYEPMMGSGNGLGGGGTFTYKNTGGKYDIIKIKLSDFTDYFNSDGSHTQYNNALGINFKYTFTEQLQSNGDKMYSSLFFESGAAVTCATPDKNGEVEIVVSRNPAHRVAFSTDFSYYIISKGGLTTGGGGGRNRHDVDGLSMGDVDCDGWVDIDDVTNIQRALSEYQKINALQIRNGDFDKDKTVSIKDVTVLQRYLADYDISEYYK